MLITIVTINKNNRNGLVRTIESVSSQNNTDFEYVIVDGNSTDGSKELIESKSFFIDKYIFGRDQGISDAFNKGITLATGKYILMLNSGDTFYSQQSIDVVLQYLVGDEGIVCFGVLNETSGENYPVINDVGRIPHQGIFVRKDIYQLLGGYSVDYKLRMDYHFLLKCKKAGVSIKCYDILVSKYEKGGVSSKFDKRMLFYREGILADYENTGFIRLNNLFRWVYWSVRQKLMLF